MRNGFLHFDDMTWPNPDDPGLIEWTLRYGEPTKEDRNVAASFIAAYKQLINDPAKVRNAKISAIRRAARESREESTDG